MFSAFYMNPFALGTPNLSNPSNFNAPIYGNASSGSQGGGASGYQGSSYGNPGGSSSAYGASSSQGGTGTGARRVLSYTAGPGFDYRPGGPSVAQSEVARVLARSTSLNPNRDIRVLVEGPVVVLRGTVASDHDRRLAEGLIRLTPGVREVRNELEVP
jgi:osmotically-inducible protein OsmY